MFLTDRGRFGNEVERGAEGVDVRAGRFDEVAGVRCNGHLSIVALPAGGNRICCSNYGVEMIDRGGCTRAVVR
jgi:hypothetical protein